MTVDARLLTLTQWLSPSFPIGAFAYSHGLESAIRDGWIEDGADLQGWLHDALTLGSARADAIWLRLAVDSPDITQLDASARAFAAASERVHEATRQGAAFARTVQSVWGHEIPPLMLPVAVGRAVALAKLDPEAATLLYLQAFLTNLVTAAQRLMPLGQTAAQGILSRLTPTLCATATSTAGCTLDDMSSTAFLFDIAAMRHETLQPRLFQS